MLQIFLGNSAMPLERMGADEIRYVCAFVGCFHVPNHTFDDAAVFESPKLCFLTPEILERSRHTGIGMVRRRSVVHQTESMFSVKDDPDEDDWRPRWWCPGKTPRLGGWMKNRDRFCAVTQGSAKVGVDRVQKCDVGGALV